MERPWKRDNRYLRLFHIYRSQFCLQTVPILSLARSFALIGQFGGTEPDFNAAIIIESWCATQFRTLVYANSGVEFALSLCSSEF